MTNAHRINSGQHPVTDGMKDFFLFVEDETEEAGRLTVDVAAPRIPPGSGSTHAGTSRCWRPCTAVPRARALSTACCSRRLRQAAPTSRKNASVAGSSGSATRSTQIRNNYEGENGVFNGTVGVVTSLDSEEQRLTVLTDEDEEVSYDFDELDELAHAYAVTIHRSQGSEYPAVVIPVTTGAWMMLQRNLLYTAVTRAKSLSSWWAPARRSARRLRTVSAGRRHTSLDHRLTT